MKIYNHSDYTRLNLLDMEILNIINNPEKIQDLYSLFGSQYTKDYIEARFYKINTFKKRLEILKQIPLIKQRSPEWYDVRKNRLTASDLGDALNFNNKLIEKKSGLVKDNTNYNAIAPLKWGVMFEPLASRCYSLMNNNIKIFEFGLIKDEDIEHFGASPDGINDLGIMIEIKCPYSREIKDGEIPSKYYKQIQGQLAVCKLEECDYIEAEFKLYDTVDNYIKNKKEYHGVIAEYKHIETGEYTYLYTDEKITELHALDDIRVKINVFDRTKDDKLQFIKLSYWYLNKINIQKVIFDKNEWKNIVPIINQFWNKVEDLKKIGNIDKKSKNGFINEDDDIKICNNEKKPKYEFIKDDD